MPLTPVLSILSAQAEVIPASVWEQIPLVALFCATFLFIIRYHLTEQQKWRDLLQAERQEAQATLERILKDQRESQLALLQMTQSQAKETFAAFSRVQSEAFEEAIEKITSQYYQAFYKDRPQKDKSE